MRIARIATPPARSPEQPPSSQTRGADGPSRDRTNSGTEHDVAQVVAVVVEPRLCDVRRDRVAEEALPPTGMALENGRAGEGDGGMARRKRLVIAAVRPQPVGRELDWLDEQSGENLRLRYSQRAFDRDFRAATMPGSPPHACAVAWSGAARQ